MTPNTKRAVLLAVAVLSMGADDDCNGIDDAAEAKLYQKATDACREHGGVPIVSVVAVGASTFEKMSACTFPCDQRAAERGPQ